MRLKEIKFNKNNSFLIFCPSQDIKIHVIFFGILNIKKKLTDFFNKLILFNIFKVNLIKKPFGIKRQIYKFHYSQDHTLSKVHGFKQSHIIYEWM
jgi:hypothetical protein